MEKLLIFFGMALATYLTRSAMIFAVSGQMSPLLHRWLRYVPPAVLAALVAPAVLAPQGHLEVGLPVWGVLAGAVVAWRTRNISWTIVAGMATYWLLRALGL